MTESQVSALLGRSLSSYETTNFDLYLEIARQTLEGLICSTITGIVDSADLDTIVYDSRKGYSTVFTDVFTEVYEVKVDGVVTTDYEIRQWDKRDATWYNSIVFPYKFTTTQEIEVSANWGFDTIPSDLQMVYAGLFDLVTKKSKQDPTIQSKKVEDFSINLQDADLDEAFYNKYSSTLAKYSICNVGHLRHEGYLRRW